jgi:hypothetical protein
MVVVRIRYVGGGAGRGNKPFLKDVRSENTEKAPELKTRDTVEYQTVE